MAKITYGPIVSEARGKAGDVVFNKSRGGNYVRALSLTAAGAGAGDGCSVYNATPVTIHSEEILVVSFDAESYDYGALHSLTVNPTRVTVTKAGLYLVIIHPVVLLQAGDILERILGKNGVDQLYYDSLPTNIFGIVTACVSIILLLAPNDYLELVFYQENGHDGTLQAGPDFSPPFIVQQLTST